MPSCVQKLKNISALILLGLMSLGGLQAQAPQVVTRPMGIWWGGYRGSEQLVDGGASQWSFVQQHMDGFILHGAYWNYATNNFGAPSPDVVGPKLATLLATGDKPVLLEHLLAGEYPDIDSAFGSAFAGNVSDTAGFGSAISNIKRLQNYGFPRPDVASDFIVETWRQAVRVNPQWTSKEFFTALTGSWDTYDGTQFDPTPGSQDRLRYGWFRQWVERLATAFPGINVTTTNSPVYFNWEEGGVNRRELGPNFNAFHTWLKLERRGDVVTAMYSGDGSGWTALGSTTIPLGATPRAGLFLSSTNANRPALGRFTNLQTLPFFTADIGKVGRGGEFLSSGTITTLAASGNDFLHPGSNTSDALSMAYKEHSGDGVFTVRLDSLVGSNAGRTNPAGETPTAGLSLRESNAPNARQVSLLANLANQLELRARSTVGGGLAQVSGSPVANLGVQTTPRWLRLTRVGSSITGAYSSDGTNWTTIGTVTVNLPTNVLVAMTADSEVRFETATAQFSNASFVTPLATSFSSANVGNAGPGAFSSFASGKTTIKASGTGMASTSDNFHMYSSAMSGDGTFLARLEFFADDVSNATPLADSAQMGITIRSSAADDAPGIAAAFTPKQGLKAITRSTSGGAASDLAVYGVGEVSIQPLNADYRPLLHYFTGNDFLKGLHESFPGGFSENFRGFTTDSPYGNYQRWGGSEAFPEAIRHRQKILLYEKWLQARGREHEFIANTEGSGPTGTQAEKDAWDLLYKNQSLRSIQLHQIEGGRPDKVFFESWYVGPFSMVPETKSGSFSNLVRDALYYIKGIDQTLSLKAQGPGGGGFSTQSPSQFTATSMGAPLVYTVRLTNTGTVPALPVLQAHETGGDGWTTAYELAGNTVKTAITAPGGLAVTDAPLYSGNELIAPGDSVDLTVTLTPTAATLRREVLIRAFWNPQDPSATERARFVLVANAPTELLINGNAETGTTAGWTSNAGGAVVADTTTVRSGTTSIRGDRSQTFQGPSQDLLGRLIPGDTYRLTAWVRLGAGTSNVKATLAYTGTTGSAVFNGLQIVGATATGWTPVDIIFRYTEPNGPATSLRLYFEGPPAGISLFVDDASLVLVPPAWTQSGSGVHFWSTNTNWKSNVLPLSVERSVITFFSGQTLPASTLTARQNLGNPFLLNALALDGIGPASASASVTIDGDPLDLRVHDGRDPTIQLTATSPSTMEYVLNTALAATGNLGVLGDGNANFRFNGILSGPGSLTKTGTSSLALFGSNSFSGGTSHQAGTLKLANSAALGTGTLTLSGGNLEALGTPALGNTIILAADTQFSGDLTLLGPAQLALGSRTLTVNAGTLTLAGILSNDSPRNLIKNGPGTLVLSAANSFAGNTIINEGALRVTHPAALGTANTTVTLPGGTSLGALELGGGITLSRPIQLAMHNTPGHAQLRNFSGNNILSGALSLNGGGARWEVTSLSGHLTLQGAVTNIATSTDTWRTLHLNGPGSGSFSGAMTDSPSGNSKLNLTVLSGEWSLDGTAKTFSGSTTVAGGALRIDTAVASSVTVASGGTLAGNGSTSGTLTMQTGSTMATRITDWNAVPTAGFGVAEFVTGGAAQWIIRVDTTGLQNFKETARTFPVITKVGAPVSATIPAITVTTTGFPGTGTWAVSASGQSLTVAYTPKPYEAWAATIAWNGRDSSLGADPDFDSLSNLMEYALASDPLIADKASQPTAALVAERLSLSFDRNPLASDVTYTVESSGNLSSWTPIARAIGLGAWQNLGGAGSILQTGTPPAPYSVTVTDAAAPNPSRFLRLQITR